MHEPTITFRLPQPMRDWVIERARKEDRAVSSLLRKAILGLMTDADVRRMDAKQPKRKP